MLEGDLSFSSQQTGFRYALPREESFMGMLKFGIMTLSLVMMSSSWVFLASFSMIMVFFWLMKQMSYSLGVISWVLTDDYSNVLILLSFWITTLMILSSYYIKWEHKMTSLFSMLVMLMTFFLIMSFSTSNLIMFYIMFEASLIPIFLMVLGWGYQPERVKASFYLLFYTLTASLPLLIGVISIYDNLSTLDLMTLYGESSQFCLYLSVPALLFLMMAFLVKMPVYFFHLWLPKAHVEAPVAGSMMLAGVLLKLGGYGLIRLFMLLENNLMESLGWFLTLSVFGALMGSLICLRQTDVKSLVAYSSVAHMGLVLFGLVSNSYLGLSGAVIIMVSHGLCSSGLFSLVGMAYERLSSRSMLVLRGGLTMTPLMSMWWFLFSVTNMAAPPSPNLIGEIMIFISSLSVSGLLTLSIGLASFLGAAFNLYMYSSTQHGNLVIGLSGMTETLYREHQILFFHFLPLLLSLFLLMNTFM